MRQPGHPSKRPTREASKPGRSKPLFNLRHKANPPIPPFPVRASNNVSLSRTHFVAKGHVKEILILKLVQGQKVLSERSTMSPWVEPTSWQKPRQRNIDPRARSGFKKDNKASTQKTIYSSRRAQARASLSSPLFPFKRVTTTHRRVIDPQARPGQKVY
jgi:hypothetical protein